MKSLRVAAVAVVVALVAVGWVRGEAFYPHIHQDVVGKGVCPYLLPRICEEMKKSQKRLDEPWRPWNSGVDKKHNCDCAFVESGQYIREMQQKALQHLIPGRLGYKDSNPVKAAEFMGNCLHTVQDFYAHSNWLENGKTTALDKTTGEFVALKPYELVPGTTDIYVVQGAVPEGWKLSRKHDSRVVEVVTKDGKKGKGLVTGTAPDYATIARHFKIIGKPNPVSPDYEKIGTVHGQCPVSISMPHWKHPFGVKTIGKITGKSSKHLGLNKDHPKAKEPESREADHYAVRKIAVEQTRHELCRVLHLAGADNRRHVLHGWVRSDKRAALLKECGLHDEADTAAQQSDKKYTPVQCYTRSGQIGKVFVESVTGDCKRTTLLRTCNNDGMCKPNKKKPCGHAKNDPHGQCWCGKRRLNECRCMQPLDAVKESRKIKCKSNHYEQM